MFNVGDLIIYSTHGLCEIDDICEKTYNDVTRTYYVMHPVEDSRLTISTPVDSNQAVMRTIMDKADAERIVQSFQEPGVQWIEDARQRNKKYNSLVNTGDRKEISKVVNTLMRKEQEVYKNKLKMQIQDRKLLTSIQSIMFKELAVSMDTSFEKISDKINSMIKKTA
ncbi:CarD family transcriptional regulator [Virgibacillus ainsalahensis]